MLSWTVGEQTGDRECRVALGSHQPATGGSQGPISAHGWEHTRHHTTQGTTGQAATKTAPPCQRHQHTTRPQPRPPQLTTSSRRVHAAARERPAMCCGRAGSPQENRQTQEVRHTQQHSCRGAHNSTHSDRPGLALLAEQCTQGNCTASGTGAVAAAVRAFHHTQGEITKAHMQT